MCKGGAKDRSASVQTHCKGPQILTAIHHTQFDDKGPIGETQRPEDLLLQAGIPGIRYLDQGSRVARDPIKLVGNQPYDPRQTRTHLASHAMDMASGDQLQPPPLRCRADTALALRVADGRYNRALMPCSRPAQLLQSPPLIPPMTRANRAWHAQQASCSMLPRMEHHPPLWPPWPA